MKAQADAKRAARQKNLMVLYRWMDESVRVVWIRRWEEKAKEDTQCVVGVHVMIVTRCSTCYVIIPDVQEARGAAERH